VPEGWPAPYSEVKGYVDPQVKFEVRLPLTTWTQRLVQTGCRGLCGMLSIHLGNDQACLPTQKGELALTSTDMGHSGGMDGKFGESDYRLRIDFAYRGVHVTTLAAKALIEKYYGQKPKYSYFAGCSEGGRRGAHGSPALPEDFNGITAVLPP
jgi:feruloyl esterase